MDNPEKLTTYGTQFDEKQQYNMCWTPLRHFWISLYIMVYRDVHLIWNDFFQQISSTYSMAFLIDLCLLVQVSQNPRQVIIKIRFFPSYRLICLSYFEIGIIKFIWFAWQWYINTLKQRHDCSFIDKAVSHELIEL